MSTNDDIQLDMAGCLMAAFAVLWITKPEAPFVPHEDRMTISITVPEPSWSITLIRQRQNTSADGNAEPAVEEFHEQCGNPAEDIFTNSDDNRLGYLRSSSSPRLKQSGLGEHAIASVRIHVNKQNIAPIIDCDESYTSRRLNSDDHANATKYSVTFDATEAADRVLLSFDASGIDLITSASENLRGIKYQDVLTYEPLPKWHVNISSSARMEETRGINPIHWVASRPTKFSKERLPAKEEFNCTARTLRIISPQGREILIVLNDMALAERMKILYPRDDVPCKLLAGM